MRDGIWNQSDMRVGHDVRSLVDILPEAGWQLWPASGYFGVNIA